MKLVFATQNKNKLQEISQLIGDLHTVLRLEDIKYYDAIPETQETIEGNASQKAFYVYNHYQMNCFADDTGLEIEALKGRPGVYSARYAGEDGNFERNIEKVLFEMQGVRNRNARFKTVISLVIDGKEKQFEGIINGVILKERKGAGGFGYDSIFVPYGHSLSFAEMTAIQKNEISHRAIAIQKLAAYLKIS